MPGERVFEPAYTAARHVLLDVLEALGTHRKSIVLVGAQAIYLHIGEGDLAVSPYTTDADLVLDPRDLDDEPDLAGALKAAGFELTVRPGTWSRANVPIDFLVPASLGGSGRRGARLGAHGVDLARKATGLEAAVVDNTLFRVGALEAADVRVFEVRVAGVAALLVAKLHKIEERKTALDRRQDKDGLDVLRLLRFAETAPLANRLMQLAANPLAGDVTRAARGFLQDLFVERNSVGAQMAVRASIGLEDETAIALSCEVLARRLLDAWR